MKKVLILIAIALCTLLTGCAGTMEQIRRDTEHINNCQDRYRQKQDSLESEYRIKTDLLRAIRIDTSRHPRMNPSDAAKRSSEINRLSYEVESLERQINYNRERNVSVGCSPYNNGYYSY